MTLWCLKRSWAVFSLGGFFHGTIPPWAIFSLGHFLSGPFYSGPFWVFPLLTSENFHYILFADDTDLISQDEILTENEFMKIQDWCTANKLLLNIDKTHQVIFKNHQKRCISTLKCTAHCKLLFFRYLLGQTFDLLDSYW